MEAQEVKLNEWLLEGVDLYRIHFGFLLKSALIAVLLTAVTGGILAGPMVAGLILVTLALYDRRFPQPLINEVFQGFQYFSQMFLFFLVWGLAAAILYTILGMLSILGQLVFILAYLAGSALLMFAPFLIVERGLGFRAASWESVAMVRSNLWKFLVFGAVAAAVGQFGAIACGVGLFLSLPFQICILSVAYREVFSGVVTERAALVGEGGDEPEEEKTDEDGPKVYEISEEEMEEMK